MTLHLTESEARVLADVLATAHREKVHELHRTDAPRYKELLRARIAVLEELRARLAREATLV